MTYGFKTVRDNNNPRHSTTLALNIKIQVTFYCQQTSTITKMGNTGVLWQQVTLNSQFTIMTKRKWNFRFFANVLTQCSVEAPFGSDYSTNSSWVWRSMLCKPGFGDFKDFFSAEPLTPCWVGWGPSVDRHVQVSPKTFYWVGQSGLWLGHLRTFRVVPKPLLHCYDYALRVIVLLEGEPLAQSEVLSTLCFAPFNPDQSLWKNTPKI